MPADIDDLDLEDLDDLEEEEEERAPKAKAKRSPGTKEKPGIGATAVAEKLGAEPKTFRAWLRRKLEAGEIEMPHEHKQRYSFKNWKDPVLVKIMALYKADEHKPRGRKPKEAVDDSPSPKKPTRKAPAKKKPAARKPRASSK